MAVDRPVPACLNAARLDAASARLAAEVSAFLIVARLSALAFAASFGQAALGGDETLNVHIPLAMLLLALIAWVLAWSWSPSSGR